MDEKERTEDGKLGVELKSHSNREDCSSEYDTEPSTESVTNGL